MTQIYFSGMPAPETGRRWDWENRPICVLMSFVYLDWWRSFKPYYRAPRSMMLDSGAFSAHKSGKSVDIDALIVEAMKPEWDEAVGLDVIGDAAGSHRNAEYMLAKGCTKAMPTFHFGDPWEYLDDYAKRWPKVGLGGMVGVATKKLLPWLEQCFARAWPKKLHSFGRCEEDILIRFPFHSADTATWVLGPMFGRVLTRGRGKVGTVKLGTKNISRDSMTHGRHQYLELLWQREQRMIARWAPTLAKLDPPAAAPAEAAS